MNKLPITLYRSEQVRELDRITIEELGIPGYELMSRAGDAVFRVIGKKWPDAQSIAVFCGGGNNGGDGFIAARLALASGMNIEVYCLSDPATLAGDAFKAYRDYLDAHGSVRRYQAGQRMDFDVIIDSMLGTGLDRPVAGLYADAIERINQSGAHVIAADIPSGLNADTGMVMACAVRAACTVTFIGLKQGMFTGSAADYCGEIIYSSLSVPNEIFARIDSRVTRVEPKPLPPRHRCAHKGQMGHVLIVGGDMGYSGAARMAGEAALRVGSGLVSVATRTEHSGLMNLCRPELMCHGVESADQLTGLLDKADVIVLGPGLGQSDWAKALLGAAIDSNKPLVVDADGLNLLAACDLKKTNWILTPHPGEASRLLSISTAEVQQDRFGAANDLQARYGGVIVLKGAGTLIASDKGISVSNTGNPGMASGGMGDVLAGAIAGLVAQGLSMKDAAEQGVYLHGLAADRAAARNGERGLLATDLMGYLRELVN
ncbi:MAG: NAD(P)H-hydrate dehydratase [Gammaproteobacteria bacterium]